MKQRERPPPPSAQTAALALSGPLEVPFTDGGRAWYQARSTRPRVRRQRAAQPTLWAGGRAQAFEEDMTLIDPSRAGERRRVDSLAAAVAAVEGAIAAAERCGWSRSRVHAFGFADGGTVRSDARCVACDAATALAIGGRRLRLPMPQVALELARRAGAGDGRLGASCPAPSSPGPELSVDAPAAPTQGGWWQCRRRCCQRHCRGGRRRVQHQQGRQRRPRAC